MVDKNELCEKIRSIYPDIGECGFAVNVEYDEKNKRWVVDLKEGGHELKPFLRTEMQKNAWTAFSVSVWGLKSRS